MSSVRRRVVCLALAMITTATVCACTNDKVTHTFTVERNVQYGARAGKALVADVYRPTGSLGQGARRAAIVMIHGGSWEQGDKSDLAGTAEGYAAAGFVAVNINYSLPPPGKRFPAELEDCEKAVSWVEANADQLGIDSTRVGAYGSSAGGNLAMMLGVERDVATIPHPVRTVVSWSGISDLTTLAPLNGKTNPNNPPAGCTGQTFCIGALAPYLMTDYLGCTKSQCPQLYAEASPITHVTSDSAPMYLTAATDDYVPFDQSLRMARALSVKSVPSKAASIPGKKHAEQLRPQALDPSITWFQSYLQ